MPLTVHAKVRKPACIEVPIALDQLAEGLRRLSRADLLTLELLLDTRAMRTIRQSLRDAKRGRVTPFSA